MVATLRVKQLSGQEIILNDVDVDDKVSKVKERLARPDLANIGVDRQRLIFRGKVLKNNETLSSYGIEDGFVVHLVSRSPSIVAASPAEQIEGEEYADDQHHVTEPANLQPQRVNFRLDISTGNAAFDTRTTAATVAYSQTTADADDSTIGSITGGAPMQAPNSPGGRVATPGRQQRGPGPRTGSGAMGQNRSGGSGGLGGTSSSPAPGTGSAPLRQQNDRDYQDVRMQRRVASRLRQARNLLSAARAVHARRPDPPEFTLSQSVGNLHGGDASETGSAGLSIGGGPVEPDISSIYGNVATADSDSLATPVSVDTLVESRLAQRNMNNLGRTLVQLSTLFREAASVMAEVGEFLHSEERILRNDQQRLRGQQRIAYLQELMARLAVIQQLLAAPLAGINIDGTDPGDAFIRMAQYSRRRGVPGAAGNVGDGLTLPEDTDNPPGRDHRERNGSERYNAANNAQINISIDGVELNDPASLPFWLLGGMANQGRGNPAAAGTRLFNEVFRNVTGSGARRATTSSRGANNTRGNNGRQSVRSARASVPTNVRGQHSRGDHVLDGGHQQTSRDQDYLHFDSLSTSGILDRTVEENEEVVPQQNGLHYLDAQSATSEPMPHVETGFGRTNAADVRFQRGDVHADVRSMEDHLQIESAHTNLLGEADSISMVANAESMAGGSLRGGMDEDDGDEDEEGVVDGHVAVDGQEGVEGATDDGLQEISVQEAPGEALALAGVAPQVSTQLLQAIVVGILQSMRSVRAAEELRSPAQEFGGFDSLNVVLQAEEASQSTLGQIVDALRYASDTGHLVPEGDGRIGDYDGTVMHESLLDSLLQRLGDSLSVADFVALASGNEKALDFLFAPLTSFVLEEVGADISDADLKSASMRIVDAILVTSATAIERVTAQTLSNGTQHQTSRTLQEALRSNLQYNAALLLYHINVNERVSFARRIKEVVKRTVGEQVEIMLQTVGDTHTLRQSFHRHLLALLPGNMDQNPFVEEDIAFIADSLFTCIAETHRAYIADRSQHDRDVLQAMLNGNSLWPFDEISCGRLHDESSGAGHGTEPDILTLRLAPGSVLNQVHQAYHPWHRLVPETERDFWIHTIAHDQQRLESMTSPPAPLSRAYRTGQVAGAERTETVNEGLRLQTPLVFLREECPPGMVTSELLSAVREPAAQEQWRRSLRDAIAVRVSHDRTGYDPETYPAIAEFLNS
eukprot:Clim_evm12s146 gene=Clim_evmTU12s146